MKTDLVLTMDEYLATCCDVPLHVIPPGRDARHIAISTEGYVGTKDEAHACRCDRWGHPCPDCEYEKEQCPPVQDSGKKQR